MVAHKFNHKFQHQSRQISITTTKNSKLSTNQQKFIFHCYYMSNLGQPEGSACCNHSETQPDRNSIAEYFRKDGEPDKDDQKAGHMPSNFTSLTKANDKVLN